MSVFHHFVLETSGAGKLNIMRAAGFFATLQHSINTGKAGYTTHAKWQSPARKASKVRNAGWVQPTYHRPARGLFVSRHAPRSPPV